MALREMLILVVILALFIMFLGYVFAYLRKGKINKITVGLKKDYIESILGKGQQSFSSLACDECPAEWD